jgi:hypothetical protein
MKGDSRDDNFVRAPLVSMCRHKRVDLTQLRRRCAFGVAELLPVFPRTDVARSVSRRNLNREKADLIEYLKSL